MADDPTPVATVIQFPRPKSGHGDYVPPIPEDVLYGMTLAEALAVADATPEPKALPPW